MLSARPTANSSLSPGSGVVMLQAFGDTTLTAIDGRDNVAVAKRESPNVILMQADRGTWPAS
jgi:hypothetical protein